MPKKVLVKFPSSFVRVGEVLFFLHILMIYSFHGLEMTSYDRIRMNAKIRNNFKPKQGWDLN
jgi:hypothetical protein